jgi:hypothetical protein
MAQNFTGTYKQRASNPENQFNAPKQMIRSKELDEQRRIKLIDWITFYRRNMHRFVEHYFGIELYFYQKIWLYFMSTRDSYVAIASRASAKTWLVGVLAVAKAVLYPNSEIVVVSSTKEQAGIIIEEKIKGLQENYPNVAREIKNITTNMNKWQVDFHNGSVIKIVAARDSSRGRRSTFTIYEEFRLIDKEVLDSVIRPFSYIRQAPYLKIPEWKNYGEEPKEVFISSAYHKGLWWFDETKKNIMDFLRGGNSGFIAFDARIAIHHHIKTKRQLKNEISKMDEITALEEYYNIPWGENSDSYFKLKQFSRSRNVERAFYPQKRDTFNSKKNPYDIPKIEGELRILSCDVAQRSGKANDLSITWCIRLLPTHKGYYREVVYGESFSGENSILQSLRIKQLYYDFSADAIVLDVASGGGGLPMYDQLGQITKDSERGLEYPPMTIMPHPSIDDAVYTELSKRTLGLNALPVVYCISATSKLNSVMAVEMRDKLQKKLFGFLVDESKAEDYLIRTKRGEFMTNDDVSAKAFFMQPYVQTSLLVNEAINLTMTLTAGNIKLSEPNGARKDRIVCLMMGNYYAGLLDSELLKQTDTSTDLETMLSVTAII